MFLVSPCPPTRFSLFSRFEAQVRLVYLLGCYDRVFSLGSFDATYAVSVEIRGFHNICASFIARSEVVHVLYPLAFGMHQVRGWEEFQGEEVCRKILSIESAFAVA